jgi:hypothetical protein
MLMNNINYKGVRKMAKITIEELSGSLKEYLNGLGLTEAQVQELIDKFEDEKIGDISQLSTEEKGSLVGAINELFQDVDSGKQLIADAIDNNNITKDSTFAAMGEAITDIHNKYQDEIDATNSNLKDILVSKNIECEDTDKISDLIEKVDLLEVLPPSIVYLYKDGDECTSVTGGWVQAHESSSTVGSRSFAKNADNMVCHVYRNVIGCRPSNPYSVNDYNFIKFEVSFSNGSDGWITLGVTYKAGDKNGYRKKITNTDNMTKKTLSVDISSMGGFLYPYAYVYMDGRNATGTLTIHKIWLER